MKYETANIRQHHFIRLLTLGMILTMGVFVGDRADARETTLLNDGWYFALGPQEDVPTMASVAATDSPWKPVRIPHDWAISGPFDPSVSGNTGKLPWRGEGWYVCQLKLDDAKAGDCVFLDFDGVMAFPKVYVNGQLAGEWDYGYMSFRVDATPFIRPGELNTVAVHCDTNRHGSRWYPGAGIYRKVTLTVCDPIHVAHWGTFVTTPEVSDSQATVKVMTTVDNASKSDDNIELETRIIDPQGNVVATKKTDGQVAAASSVEISQTLTVDEPKRWDIESPYLYRAETTIASGDRTCDTSATRFGIRTFKWTADDGFYLNGRREQLYGVDLHHDQGPLGAAFYRRAMQRQLEIMKDMGVNAIRTSHNPGSPELVELCDEMGLLVYDECFDKWDATADLPGYPEGFEPFMRRQVRNFVMRDRNSPSVVIWSIGNEISYILSNRDGNAPQKVAYMHGLFKEFDPTRPTSMGCNGTSAVAPGRTILDALDTTGWNYNRKYAKAKERYPDKPVIYTESASAFSTRGHYELPHPTGKTDYSPSLQITSYDYNSARWSDIPDREFELMETDRYCAGEFVWTGFDYLGEPTPHTQDARSSYFGIVDLCGMPKDRFYLYRSHWRPDTTTVHILPHWNWPERIGKPVPVYVYTNGDSAELFLNGKSLGRRTKQGVLPEPESLAKGKTATASTEETDKGKSNLASNGCDGDPSTRWCAANESPEQWWQVDLGSVQQIRSCRILFEKEAWNYRYRLLASEDGQSWTTLVEKDKWEGKNQSIVHSLDTKARYVKIEFTGLKPNCWASFYELELYATNTVAAKSYYSVIDRYRLRWEDVTYEPGELRAVAYKDGKEIGEASVKTAGPPAAIRLTADRTTLDTTERDDLCYIQVEAVDANGTVCPKSDAVIDFRVTGPAEIVAVGNGNPRGYDCLTDATHPLFYGKAMLILRSKPGNKGEIKVYARAEGLPEAEISISRK